MTMSHWPRILCSVLVALPACALHAMDNPAPVASPIPAQPIIDTGSGARPYTNSINGVQALAELRGWVLAGSAPQDYRVGYVATFAPKVTARISLKPDAKGSGFGTVMQTISAEDYRGKRLRFSALLQPRDVESGAGIWFRVDSADGRVLAFDNMQSRPVLGTQTWKRYDVVVDVPDAAARLAYGVLLIGKGAIGIDDLQFDVVGKDVATTDMMALPKAPVNLELKQ
jgi:hypothetical protein